MKSGSVRVLAAVVCGLTACVARRPAVVPDRGIRSCPSSADENLLSADALQCWFTAPHGRWRTLSHESHYAVLVVSVEAADVRDAGNIAQRFVDRLREQFSEILVYVQRDSQKDAAFVRRVRWTRNSGFETLDFMAPVEQQREIDEVRLKPDTTY